MFTGNLEAKKNGKRGKEGKERGRGLKTSRLKRRTTRKCLSNKSKGQRNEEKRNPCSMTHEQNGRQRFAGEEAAF